VAQARPGAPEAGTPGPGAGPGTPKGAAPGSGVFELLEHTADVGIRARGASLEEAFEQATIGLAEVLGARRPDGRGEPVAVEVAADDPGGLLVDWLNEVLWLREVRQAVVTGVTVERAGDGAASGSVTLAGGGPEPDGTFVKAVTYHRLRVERDPGGGWLAEVYLDV
jgi:SHS2 domain-containing protein